ncbi:MAG: hypothetical protein HFE76_06445 [Firmicutes bacterium]|nr:hypothetical protein [Bacillota bacterium]
MDKRKAIVLAAGLAAGLVLIVTFILTIVTMVNVKALQATLETINISYGADRVVYENGDEETSILAGSSLKFAGEDTISLKSKTIKCSASITPIEFQKGTKVKLKVLNDGKVYPLKRKENSFEGSIRLPLFEDADVEVIMEDGDNVRSEYLEQKSAYISKDIAWTAFWAVEGNSEPRRSKDSVLFKQYIDPMAPGSGNIKEFPEIQVVGLTDGKQVYKKTVIGEYRVEQDSEENIWSYLWEGKVPLDGSKKVELYVTAPAKAGLTYRFKIGQVQKNMKDQFWDEEGTDCLEILAPDGTVLNKTMPYEEADEEEENEI